MAKNVDPLVRQIRALLNSYGQMSDKTLDTSGGSQDQATGAYNFPILHKILGMGYGYGQNQGMDSWIHSFDTDKDAIGQAITNLRSGFALGQDHLRTHNPYGEDSASNNLYRSLIDERVKAGMSKQEAYDSVRNAVMGELTASKATPVVDKATDKYSTLNPAEQQTLAARSVGANTDSPNPNFDPAAMAQAQMLQQYYDRGSNDISQYGQIANIMGGMVPEQLQPLYQLMTQQRLQEMTNNLNQTYGQMQNAPYIQMLKDAAADFRASAKGSGSGGSNGPLGALRQAAGGTGGEIGRAHV